MSIAEYGYGTSNPGGPGAAAFMPLMPWVMRWGGAILGDQPLVAGAIAANLGALIAACSLYILVRMGLRKGEPLSHQTATFATAFFLISPLSLPLFLAYSEPLLLALALPAWIAARHEKWWLAGLLMSGAVLARVTGLSFGLGVGVMYLATVWRRMEGEPYAARFRALLRPSLGWTLLPLAVYAAWDIRLAQLTGRLDAVAYAQRTVWHRSVTTPWNGFINSVHGFITFNDRQLFAETIATLVILALALVLARLKMWPELALVGSACFVLMCSSVWGSSLRGLEVMFPFWSLTGVVAVKMLRGPSGLSWVGAALVLSGLGLFWWEMLITNGRFVA